MSAEENTHLAQSAYESFGRGDMPALAEVMADDIEWVIPGDPNDNPIAGTYRGAADGQGRGPRLVRKARGGSRLHGIRAEDTER